MNYKLYPKGIIGYQKRVGEVYNNRINLDEWSGINAIIIKRNLHMIMTKIKKLIQRILEPLMEHVGRHSILSGVYRGQIELIAIFFATNVSVKNIHYLIDIRHIRTCHNLF